MIVTNSLYRLFDHSSHPFGKGKSGKSRPFHSAQVQAGGENRPSWTGQTWCKLVPFRRQLQHLGIDHTGIETDCWEARGNSGQEPGSSLDPPFCGTIGCHFWRNGASPVELKLTITPLLEIIEGTRPGSGSHCFEMNLEDIANSSSEISKGCITVDHSALLSNRSGAPNCFRSGSSQFCTWSPFETSTDSKQWGLPNELLALDGWLRTATTPDRMPGVDETAG